MVFDEIFITLFLSFNLKPNIKSYFGADKSRLKGFYTIRTPRSYRKSITVFKNQLR